jgi:hypothetical protein
MERVFGLDVWTPPVRHAAGTWRPLAAGTGARTAAPLAVLVLNALDLVEPKLDMVLARPGHAYTVGLARRRVN